VIAVQRLMARQYRQFIEAQVIAGSVASERSTNRLSAEGHPATIAVSSDAVRS